MTDKTYPDHPYCLYGSLIYPRWAVRDNIWRGTFIDVPMLMLQKVHEGGEFLFHDKITRKTIYKLTVSPSFIRCNLRAMRGYDWLGKKVKR